MKRVRFILNQLPIIQYEKEEIKKLLRDKFAQYLVKCSLKKLDLGEIAGLEGAIEYISAIFQKALGPKLSHQELEKIESMHVRFSFLQYHKTSFDNIIHGTAHYLVALCSGDKKIVGNMLSRSSVLDAHGNVLCLRKGLDWEHSKALREDVASLTRECVKEFLKELQETGKIMTSAELAEHQLSAAIEEHTGYSDDEFETDTDSSNSSASASDSSAAIDPSMSNYEARERAASLTINPEETNTNKDKEAITVESTSSSQTQVILDQLLAWIYELPEWLQTQTLNSLPIKALIESVNQAAAIYNMNSLQDFITQATPSEPASNSAEVTEEDMWQKAQVYDPYTTDAIDMTMIWKEPAVSGWIMPMIGMESGTMFFDNAHAFNDLPHHGYGVDAF